MLRYWIPVSGSPHLRAVSGPVMKVAATRLGAGPDSAHTVDFWAEGTIDGPEPAQRVFQVFGTGHPLPEGALWRGTCDRTPEGLVWHLYELTEGLEEA